MFKKIVEGSIYLLISLVITKILSMIYTFMLARTLGPVGLGTFSLAILVSSWVATVALLSIQMLSTKVISEYLEKGKDISAVVTSTLITGFISGSLGSLATFLSANIISTRVFHDATLSPYVALGSMLIFCAVLYNAIMGIERGLKKFKRYALLDSGKQALTVTLGFILILLLGYNVWGALWAVIAAQLAAICIMITRYKKYLTFKVGGELKRFLSSGGWLTALAFSISLFTSLDRFFLGSLLSKENVGLYVPASTIITMLGLFLPSAIKNAALPFIVESYAGNRLNETRYYLEKILRYYLSMTGYLLIGVMIFRAEIISIIFGEKYLPLSANILGILLFAVIFFATYMILHSFIIGIDKAKEATIVVVLVIAMAALIYPIFIKRLGLNGAAVATIISILVLALLYTYLVIKTIKPNLKKTARLIIIINLFLGVSYLIQTGLCERILLGAILVGIYSIIIISLKCLTRRDIVFIITNVRKKLAKLSHKSNN